jgi:astacin
MDRSEVYSAFMEKGTVKEGYLFLNTKEIVPIKYTEIDGLAIYQGDIILGKAEMMEKLTKRINSAGGIEKCRGLKSNIIAVQGEIWPNNRIAYELDNSARDSDIIKKLINEALEKFNASGLSVKICERTGADKNYICFYKSTEGCSSYVGMQGGGQPVKISENAIYGNVMHELCHAAGLWHEHSREDRDIYIIINTANIDPNAMHNFEKTGAAGQDFGDYDYGSIMHYGAYAFAKDRKCATISPTQSAAIGQRDRLSSGDIAGLKVLYPDPPRP